MSHRVRWGVGAAGLAAGAAGTVATFVNTNGAGAAALVAVGAAGGSIAAIGRWPSRVTVSGHEIEWLEIRQTIDSQISRVEDADGTGGALSELRLLRERLTLLERTGRVAPEPAELYDQDVLAALERLAPGVVVKRSVVRSRSVPDFEVRKGGRVVHVETKWRSDVNEPFAGSTLPTLLEALGDEAPLIVVVNSRVLRLNAFTHRPEVAERLAVLPWLDASDDAALGSALRRWLD
jgi:hypothetical protein